MSRGINIHAMHVFSMTRMSVLFSETHDLIVLLDDVNNSLEATGYQGIQVQCMYGKYVADDLRLRSIEKIFWRHEIIDMMYPNPLRRSFYDVNYNYIIPMRPVMSSMPNSLPSRRSNIGLTAGDEEVHHTIFVYLFHVDKYITKTPKCHALWPLLLIWFNFDPNTHKKSQ